MIYNNTQSIKIYREHIYYNTIYDFSYIPEKSCLMVIVLPYFFLVLNQEIKILEVHLVRVVWKLYIYYRNLALCRVLTDLPRIIYRTLSKIHFLLSVILGKSCTRRWVSLSRAEHSAQKGTRQRFLCRASNSRHKWTLGKAPLAADSNWHPLLMSSVWVRHSAKLYLWRVPSRDTQQTHL